MAPEVFSKLEDLSSELQSPYTKIQCGLTYVPEHRGAEKWQIPVHRNYKDVYCSGWLFQLSLEVLPPLMLPMTVTPLGRDQGCNLKIREPDVPAPWFLDPGAWSKTAAVSLYFIFPGICTLSL
ncbi:hypothetical protein STEG23_007543, partial [Scotinomys teguina]